jgi:F0F1-type ATP synthase assembly protein I
VVGLDDDASVRRRYGRLAGLGVQFGAAITVFALAGLWLDKRVGTSPLFTVLGVLLGFAGGTISLVKAVGAANRDPREDKT